MYEEDVLPAHFVSVFQNMYNMAKNCFARNNFILSVFIVKLLKRHNARGITLSVI